MSNILSLLIKSYAMGRHAPRNQGPARTALVVTPHFIVPASSKDRNAVAARDVLVTIGMNINDAANGVFLARNSSCAAVGVATSSKLHTRIYCKHVYDSIKNETTREGLVNALSIIRTQILYDVVPR